MTTMVDVGPCYRCKCVMWIPQNLEQAARRSSKIEFFCAYGHGQIFAEGESDLDKLRRERDQLAQRIAQRDDRIKALCEEREAANRRAAAARGRVTKIKNRVGHGVCPCCNRTFENLARHMTSQHPSFAEAAE
jgi:hypothetical protein